MSDKAIRSRQSQSKHKIYYFKTGVLAPAGQGAAPSNPYKKGTVRLRPYEDEEKEPMGKYLSADDQRLLVDYGERTQKGEFGIDAKYMYVDLAERLENSKDEAGDVKEILKLLGIIDHLKGDHNIVHNLHIALKEAFPESKHIKDLYSEMKKAQTKSKSSSMNDPPEIDNTDVPPNESILVEKTNLFRDIQGDLGGSEKRKALEKQKASRSASREKDISRPTDPDYMDKIDETIHEYRDDPTDSTKMMDSGGANIDLLGESLGLSKRTPSAPPYDQYLDSDIPQDMRNQRAIDFNTYIGGNPYKIRNDLMERADEQERMANVKEYDHYLSEIANMSRNPSILDGGGTDVTGKGKGDLKDLMDGGDEQKAPASYDLSNPRGMRDQMKPKQPRDGSIDPMGGTPADNNVDRNDQNSGFNFMGYTPEQIRDRLFGAGLSAGSLGDFESAGRLAERSLADFVANRWNSEGAGGSGIASEIASYVDLADAGDIGSRYGQRQSNGADDGGSFITEDPRSMSDRFSNMGMRRQGDKIDKYVNMKNKGMMYSNLMGKGVSDPSIQSIRDRKDDYIQPNGKHKGNSVNLIRQSNATSIRLNNMYMP